MDIVFDPVDDPLDNRKTIAFDLSDNENKNAEGTGLMNIISSLLASILKIKYFWNMR